MDEKILDLIVKRFSHHKLKSYEIIQSKPTKVYPILGCPEQQRCIVTRCISCLLLQKTIYNGTCTGISNH